MLKHIEMSFKEIISGRKHGLGPSIILAILRILSWGYGLGIFFRNKLFDLGLRKSYDPKAHVIISIGSIVAGGTGKTPVTLLLAKSLSEHFSIAILSRGYRSKAEKRTEPLILNAGKDQLTDASECGDEPLLLAQNLPNSSIYIFPNRSISAQLAVKNGAQALILDDGMQHRMLHRDFDIIILDSRNPFGFKFLLPRGLLRENLSALKRADLIIFHHTGTMTEFQKLKAQVFPYSDAPIIGSRLHVEGVYDLNGSRINLTKGQKMGLLCGIAQPESFKQTVKSLGINVVCEKIIPDHCELSDDELARFLSDCRSQNASAIICTEKDKVKIKSKEYSFPIYWVKVELQIVFGEKEWGDFLVRIMQK